jgi:hypothetical protein
MFKHIYTAHIIIMWENGKCKVGPVFKHYAIQTQGVEYNIRLLGSIYIFVICGDKSG